MFGEFEIFSGHDCSSKVAIANRIHTANRFITHFPIKLAEAL